MQPTPPRRVASLHRRSLKRDQNALSVSSSAMAHPSPSSTTTGVSMASSTVDDEDLVYVISKHVVARRVPMESHTELVPFHRLPKEAQRRPTETLTWAQQTPEYLFLETIVPPQCKVCLARLEGMATETAQTPKSDPMIVQDTIMIEQEDTFVESLENLTSLQEQSGNRDRYDVSNLPTPALLIPGRYLWGT